MSLLVALPPFILAAGAISILVIHQFQPQFRSTWMLVVVCSLLATAVTLALRWVLPPPLAISGWMPYVDPLAGALRWQIDSISWPYALSLAGLLFAMFVTGAARLYNQPTHLTWVNSLLIGTVGLLAVLSGNPLTLVLAWTSIDIVEVSMVLVQARGEAIHRQAVLAFGARVAGTLLLLWAILRSVQLGECCATFDQLQPRVFSFLIAAAGLRLGVLPLNLPFTEELPVRRGLGTILRLVAPAASLTLLARMPAQEPVGQLLPLMVALTVFATLYGAVMWLTARDELQGRPYWLVGMSGLAMACLFNGQPAASIPWGLTAILTGGFLFLFSARRRSLLWLPGFSLLAASGLPFTPSAAGWDGLIDPSQPVTSALLVLAFAILWLGALRHALHPGEPLANFEAWVQGVYPIGLVILPVIYILTWVFGDRSVLSIGRWQPAAGFVVIILLGLVVYYWRRMRVVAVPERWAGLLLGRIGAVLARFLRLEWLYRLVWTGYQLLQRGVHLITLVLEGEGGVLWAVLLLVLLVSLFQPGSVSR